MTRRVFEQIKNIQPEYLYIAADGPRTGNHQDELLCQETRSIVESVDWDCSVKLLFRDENVGCGAGPAGAITWFFEHVDMGIILEDDCVPSLPFFSYCESMLENYRYDEQVWIVSGRVHCPNSSEFKKYDYIFSNHAYTWGWATWKRCWQKFEIDIEQKWHEFYSEGGFTNIYFSKVAGLFSNYYYSRLFRNGHLKNHAWDYQFMFCMSVNRGLGILPAKNLVENIGYEGTHFSGETSWLKIKASEYYSARVGPKYILPNREYDRYHFYHELGTRIKTFIRNKIGNLFR